MAEEGSGGFGVFFVVLFVLLVVLFGLGDGLDMGMAGGGRFDHGDGGEERHAEGGDGEKTELGHDNSLWGFGSIMGAASTRRPIKVDDNN